MPRKPRNPEQCKARAARKAEPIEANYEEFNRIYPGFHDAMREKYGEEEGLACAHCIEHLVKAFNDLSERRLFCEHHLETGYSDLPSMVSRGRSGTGPWRFTLDPAKFTECAE